MFTQRVWPILLITGVLMLAMIGGLHVTSAAPAESDTSTATGPGTTFTYQGQLKNNGQPVTADCLLAFRLYDAVTEGAVVAAPITRTVPITDGLFTVALDFGADVFAGDARWLGIRVRCPGDAAYTDLGRQALTAAPYALYALGASWSGLRDVPSGFADGIDDVSVVVSGTQVYAGEGLTRLASGDAVTLSLSAPYRLPQVCANGQIAEWNGAAWVCGNDDVGAGGAYWALNGNAGTNPLVNFVGTTDAVSLTLAVDGAPALRLEPNATSPNVVGGYRGNVAWPGVYGASIGGGGASTAVNGVYDLYGTVGGGIGNAAYGEMSTVGGGDHNAASYLATVGGGDYNHAEGDFSVVAGGDANHAALNHTFVGGGLLNYAGGPVSVIGGGESISVTGYAAVVAGGAYITVTGDYAAVGGGGNNLASGYAVVIGGGGGFDPWLGAITNTASGDWSVIGGGGRNIASSIGAVIGGGWDNIASGDRFNTVGGGFSNTASGEHATVCGGMGNDALGDRATIGGGGGNSATGGGTVGGGIANTANGGTIAGGYWNVVTDTATIGGGQFNQAEAYYATIAGGGPSDVSTWEMAWNTNNRVLDDYGVIGGGGWNRAGNGGITTDAPYATVAGGYYNYAYGAYATVGGGYDNDAYGAHTVVAGGYDNFASSEDATVGGGYSNLASHPRATVSGGYDNEASSNAATVPGGASNIASGAYSFAAGAQANATHVGSFVWSSGETTDSWGDRTFTARAHGGVRFYTASGTGTGAVLPAGSGSWGSLSDRSVKANFVAVDGRDILVRLAAIPIQIWNYTAQDPSIRHIGPMAQDFYAAFGVGEDERYISTIDADGVALAAIQALYAENQALESRVTDLEMRLAALEAQMNGNATSAAPLPWALAAGGLFAFGVVVVQRRHGGGTR